MTIELWEALIIALGFAVVGWTLATIQWSRREGIVFELGHALGYDLGKHVGRQLTGDQQEAG